MKISTKGRYALRVMIDLAQNNDLGFLSLKDIAERQGISMKYLESIVAILNKAEYVESLRGKSGGYKLNKSPSEYTVGAILKLTEGSMAPVKCLDVNSNDITCEIDCDRAMDCITLPMWKKLDKLIDDYLESVTIEDLLKNGGDLYQI